MKVFSLISGGKDSCYCMLQCIAAGHEIVALGNITPKPNIDEMDSYMYQSVGHEVIPMYAEAMNLPLFQRETLGTAINQTQTYMPSTNDEVEDLYQLLKEAREKMDFEAVSSGAILSNYQRVRVESVCTRLGLVSISYLWQRDQRELLQEMIDTHIKAIIIKVASLGLDPKKVLGNDICTLRQHLFDLNEKYQLNVCGEGGEYETLVLDCPLFKKKINILEQEIVWVSQDNVAPVAFLKIKKVELEDKEVENASIQETLETLHVKKPDDYVKNFYYFSHEHATFCPCECCSFDLDVRKIKFQENLIGNDLWIAGLVGIGETISESTETAMQKLSTAVIENNMTMRNLIKINIYIQSMSKYDEFNAVYKKYFDVNPPVRACVQVPLPSNIHFLMDCYATTSEFETLHVQSVSHWAPANIGPYSQAVATTNLIHTSGQIALVPGSMMLLEKSHISVQNNLIFRHITRIVKALKEVDLNSLIVGVCYVINESMLTNVKNFMLKYLNGVHPLVVTVIVTGLPRDASVEWQMIAKINAQSVNLSCKDVEFPHGMIKMSICESDSDDFMLLKWFLMDEVPLDEKTLSLGFKLVDPKLKVGCAQLFCTVSSKDLEFYKVVEDAFDKCCVSIIPVVGFDEAECVFIALLHCVK